MSQKTGGVGQKFQW